MKNNPARFSKLAIGTVLIFAALPARANLISNPSFETFTGVFAGDGGAQLTASSTSLTGWSITNGEIAILRSPNSYSLSASDANNFLDLAGYSNTGLPKGIAQNVAGFVVGQQYALTLDIGIRNGPCVFGGNNCAGPVSVNATIAGANQTLTHNATDPGNIWGTYGLVFTATDTTLPLQIRGTSLPSGYQYIGLDNISIEAVPVPAAAWLFGSGLAGIAGVAGRRRESVIMKSVTHKPLTARKTP